MAYHLGKWSCEQGFEVLAEAINDDIIRYHGEFTIQRLNNCIDSRTRASVNYAHLKGTPDYTRHMGAIQMLTDLKNYLETTGISEGLFHGSVQYSGGGFHVYDQNRKILANFMPPNDIRGFFAPRSANTRGGKKRTRKQKRRSKSTRRR